MSNTGLTECNYMKEKKWQQLNEFGFSTLITKGFIEKMVKWDKGLDE